MPRIETFERTKQFETAAHGEPADPVPNLVFRELTIQSLPDPGERARATVTVSAGAGATYYVTLLVDDETVADVDQIEMAALEELPITIEFTAPPEPIFTLTVRGGIEPSDSPS